MMYTYDPSKIPEGGRDRMRFELGDVMPDVLLVFFGFDNDNRNDALAFGDRLREFYTEHSIL